MIVVSDTSPVRAFAFLDRLSVLESLFGAVIVPAAVADELRNPARLAPTESNLDLSAYPFIEIRSPRSPVRVAELERELDRGESEALALAEELGAEAVLIDESAGRAVAERLGLVPLGTVGLLVRAKRLSLIDELNPVLDRLTSNLGFFIAEPIRRWALNQVGE